MKNNRLVCLNEYLKYQNHYNKSTYSALLSFASYIAKMNTDEVSELLHNLKVKNRSI